MDSNQQITDLEEALASATAELEAHREKHLETAAQLRDKEGILLALSEYSRDLTFILSENSTFTYVSPSICHLTEYEAEDILNADPGGFFHVDDLDLINEAIREALAHPGEAVPVPDHRVRHHDLRWLYFEGSAVSMPDVPGVDGVVFNCHDITERKLQEETIYRQANYDALTKLPNRLMFSDRLSLALLRGSREKHYVGLLFLDLDGFKKVNDTLGHSAGDELLKEVAQRLIACVRQDDTISRLGGDEFTVVLPNIRGPLDAEIVATKILERVSEAITLGDNEVYISASIGITIFPDDTEDQETLIRHADTAMYEAKAAGRRTYRFFTSEMNAAAILKLELETELRAAIEREEFDIRFQPIIELKSEAIVGAEALVRWNHPERGLVSPDLFIPLAEEQGMIVAIGEWVMKAACAQVLRWREDGQNELKMAINVSPRQCQEPGFDALVERILNEAELTSDCITLEITESLFIEGSHEDAVTALHNCRSKGSLLSLDDFGTGYSSLSYLKRFPVDVLKIDRAFIMDIVSSAEDKALCQAIIAMAHAFNLKVVGEGVETVEHAQILHDLNCDRAQGYLMSKPLTADEFGEFLGSWDGMPK